MEPFTSAVLTSLAGTAVKSLFTGSAPDGEAWAAAVTAVLSALMADRAATDRTLQRIEEKLDRAAAKTFDNPLRAGLRLLDDAQPHWRSPADRDRMLHDARNKFIDAVVAAPDSMSTALAEWHVALAWTLSRSVPDATAALERARHAVFKAALDARFDWAWPDDKEINESAQNSLTAVERAWHGFAGLDMTERRRHAQRQLRKERAVQVTEALALAATVQQTFTAIGRPSWECAPPTLLVDELPDTGDWNQNPEIAVRLAPVDPARRPNQPYNLVLGHPLAVHEARVTETVDARGKPAWAVDVDLVLGVAAGNTLPIAVNALSLEKPREYHPAQVFPSARERLLGSLAVRALPEPRLLADKSESAPNSMVSPPAAGRYARGWLRVGSTVKPDTIALRIWPYGRRNPLDQGLIAIHRIG